MAKIIFHHPLTGFEISFQIKDREIIVSDWQQHKVEELVDWLSLNQYNRLVRKFPSINNLVVKIKI